MRVLVIGASGFLGAHVRNRACAAGMEVVTAGRSGLSPTRLATCGSTWPPMTRPGSPRCSLRWTRTPW